MVVWIGGQQVIAGTITMGNIAEFIIYVNLLTWPIASIGWVTSLVQRAAASQERINEFLRIQPDIQKPPRPPKGGVSAHSALISATPPFGGRGG